MFTNQPNFTLTYVGHLCKICSGRCSLFTQILIQIPYLNLLLQVNLVDWGDAVHMEPIDFWAKVGNYTDASGERTFSNLAAYALKILCLPISNADVERVFSQVNLLKNDLRNRMSQELLSALLYIRSSLRCYEGEERKKCRCPDFQPTENMLKAVQDSSFYDHHN